MSSLGLLAKDSIQDLASLLRDADDLSVKSEGSRSDCKQASTPKTEPLTSLEPETLLTPFEIPQTTATQQANPQQAGEEEENGAGTNRKPKPLSSAANSYGQYTGFRADYYPPLKTDDESLDYPLDPYAPSFVLEQGRKPLFPKLTCCLFPWMSTSSSQALPPSDLDAFSSTNSFEQETTGKDSNSLTAAAIETPLKLDTDKKNVVDDDEGSNSSDVFGEKLSDKERQAVLARLGLAPPDSDASESSVDKKGEKKGLLNGIPVYDISPLQSADDEDVVDGRTFKKLKGILKRGSLLDLTNKQSQQSLHHSNNNHNNKADGPRRRNLFPQSYGAAKKGSKSLHATFAPMARVVTVKSKKDMTPQEKADIWWQRSDYEDFRKTGRIITKAMLTGGSEIWLQTDAVKPKTKNQIEPTKNSDGSIAVTGDKWWHEFGHSRRGLEHVVSMEEGRDRQLNVRNAIRAVLEEHNKQKAFKKEDPERLRIVSLNHTTWARDLALAAGSSDADAVKSCFAEGRKSREFFLSKMSKNNADRNMPNFMLPDRQKPAESLVSPRKIQQQARLDANTAAQLSFKRRLNKPAAAPVIRKESSEPIKDPDPADHTEKLAHRAAGFNMVEGEKVDMAAALAGMGAVPQEVS